MKKLIVCIFCIAFIFPNVYAIDTTDVTYQDTYEEQKEIIGADKIKDYVSDEGKDLMGDISLDADLGQAVGEIVSKTSNAQKNAFKNAIGSISKILAISIFCSIAKGYIPTGNVTGASETIKVAGAIGIAGCVFGDFKNMISLCIQAIDNINIFSKGMLPVMASAVTISGSPTAGIVTNSITIFSFDILVSIINGILVPMVCAYIAIITANAAIGNDVLGRFADFIKWATTSILKVFLTAFVTYITVSGIVSGNVDGMSVKTARLALSASVPVVGGIISDATESILSGAMILKNSVGVFGMISIVAICIIPFITILISYLTFKGGTAIISPVCEDTLTKLTSGISDGLGMLLGMLGTCTAMIFYELVFTVSMISR